VRGSGASRPRALFPRRLLSAIRGPIGVEGFNMTEPAWRGARAARLAQPPRGGARLFPPRPLAP